jgi:heat-inducible transcriptional repressor
MSDEVPQRELTKRQRKLLETLIREYIASPEPVSSRTLMHVSDLGVSSATIRNEMSVLEEAGYIRAPHTSAGRVPTEDGYRYMVKQLLNDPPKGDVSAFQAHFRDIPAEMEAWMQHAAVVLANETHTAALVTEPRLKSRYRFKQVQLIGVQGRLVLMVLVLDGANVHQQMLIMAEPIPQEKLNVASEKINRNCVDLTAEQLREKARTLSGILAQEIGEIVADALQTLRDEGSRVVYRAGLSNVLPDFEDDGARQAIKVLEGNISLDQIVDEFRESRVGAVHALVGGNGRYEEFNRLSMIFARYGTAHVIGTVGVVGPTRMRYGSAISAVSSVAELISKFLTEVHGDDDTLAVTE